MAIESIYAWPCRSESYWYVTETYIPTASQSGTYKLRSVTPRIPKRKFRKSGEF